MRFNLIKYNSKKNFYFSIINKVRKKITIKNHFQDEYNQNRIQLNSISKINFSIINVIQNDSMFPIRDNLLILSRIIPNATKRAGNGNSLISRQNFNGPHLYSFTCCPDFRCSPPQFLLCFRAGVSPFNLLPS